MSLPPLKAASDVGLDVFDSHQMSLQSFDRFISSMRDREFLGLLELLADLPERAYKVPRNSFAYRLDQRLQVDSSRVNVILDHCIARSESLSRLSTRFKMTSQAHGRLCAFLLKLDSGQRKSCNAVNDLTAAFLQGRSTAEQVMEYGYLVESWLAKAKGSPDALQIAGPVLTSIAVAMGDVRFHVQLVVRAAESFNPLHADPLTNLSRKAFYHSCAAISQAFDLSPKESLGALRDGVDQTFSGTRRMLNRVEEIPHAIRQLSTGNEGLASRLSATVVAALLEEAVAGNSQCAMKTVSDIIGLVNPVDLIPLLSDEARARVQSPLISPSQGFDTPTP
ncbi:hypothetical protein HNP46_004314 [Pseudomonas nitritireducens]|uniref:Uncharacterized protein n=1 Tax=Pseudomonas nitroreducens TaxID=46680 RepID=A0A7W7P210_PSENT|nr:hypothetical protein [Pseudomonas nitritireducens]MBB4865433.1 hypothetical protein [Pseudomonas nitritireducens]